ncbi:coiled-coil domain-containing protein 50-like isoform X2 [Ornithodoros turicata]
MECSVRSMAEASVTDDQTVVPEGRVGQVCKEWVVREDGVLAYRLQTQEISQHYNLNRTNNQLLRNDLPLAKTVQRTEEEEATMIREAYERMLQEQEEHDAKIALELQQQLQREAALHASLEEEDKRLALELQRRDLPRKLEKIERRRRDDALPAALRKLSLGASGDTTNGGDDLGDSDFSDFCLQPPSHLEGEQLRKFCEDQDAELARLLQEQETKRRGPSARDRQIAIEAQDRELAKLLQDQERARARRAREKARQRAQMQQQQQQEMDTIEELGHTNHHHHAVPESSNGQPTRTKSQESVPTSEGDMSFLVGPGVKNIAVELDPTFERRKESLERQGSGSSNRSNSSSGMSPLTPPPSAIGGSTSSPALSNACYVDPDEGAVPPYMPIQGQRRSKSLEKGKKGKRARDACRQQ